MDSILVDMLLLIGGIIALIFLVTYGIDTATTLHGYYLPSNDDGGVTELLYRERRKLRERKARETGNDCGEK